MAWPGCRARGRAGRSGASRRAWACRPGPCLPASRPCRPRRSPGTAARASTPSSGAGKPLGLAQQPGADQPRQAPQSQMERADLERGVDPHAAQARIALRQQIEIGRVARAEPARAEARHGRGAAGPASRAPPSAAAVAGAANGRPSVLRIDCVVARPGSKLLPGEMTMLTASSAANRGACASITAADERRHRARPAHHQHAGRLASASSAPMPVTKPRASARSR